MSNTINPTLMQKLAAAKAAEAEAAQARTTTTSDAPQEGDTGEFNGAAPAPESLENPVVVRPATKSYQLPSAPCTFSFPASLGGPRVCMEGVLTISDPDEIKYADAAVKVGNIRLYDENYKTRETTLPTPARKAQDQNNGIVL